MTKIHKCLVMIGFQSESTSLGKLMVQRKRQ